MSTFAVIVLTTFSVVYSLRILGVQQGSVADNLHNHRDKDANLRHQTAAVEQRSIRGRGFFDCKREKALIELTNTEIHKYQKTFDAAQTLRQDAEQEAHLPTQHRREAERYLYSARLRTLTNELNARIAKLQRKIAREKRSWIGLFCSAKKDVILRQGDLIFKYEEIIEFNMNVVQSLERKVIDDQTRLIDECEAMLSDISAKKKESGISREEVALRDALDQNIETLDSVKWEGRRVIGYQKKVIDKYKNVLVVSFARLKEEFEPNEQIEKMQTALENLLNADIDKMVPRTMTLHPSVISEDIEALRGQ